MGPHTGTLRWRSGALLLLVTILAPALALAQTAPVRPILECVTQEGPSQYTAVFGYKNENPVPITIPVGASNKLTPLPQDRVQTTVFQPGRTPYDQGAFRVPFPGSHLVWTLRGPDGSTRTSTASAKSKRCPGPALTDLAPESLTLTPGTSGTLTATIRSAQASAVLIALTSSDPTVAAVPALIPVPAKQVVARIPVSARSPGTATITATLNGSTRQSTVTVLAAGPTLTSLLPATLPVTPGATGTLTLTLSAAQATDTVVPLRSSDGGLVSVPATVTVPAGAVTVPVAVAAVAPGTATITAGPLNGTSAHSQVTVSVPPPTVVSLAPPVLPLTEGSTGTLTVTLSASQPTDTEVAFGTSDPLVVGLPGDRILVPAHTLAASFTVTGLARGTATVTASLNGATATSAVTVQPAPPTVSAFACPATLTVGATGQCTVTLNATQLMDTLVPLTVDAPAVLTVPPAVTVPAGQAATAVQITAGIPGMATLSAGPLHDTTAQATVQVLPPPPALVGLTPDPTTLLVGASTTLTLTLSAAQATDTVVPLSVSPTGILTVPTTVIVPAASVIVAVPVAALTMGSAVLTAGPLNGTIVDVVVTVTQLPATVSGLTPPDLTLPKGTAASFTVTIAPVQSDPTAVPLTSSDPATVEVPASVPVPAGSATAPFPVIGRSVGTATVTAGPLEGTTAQATVTVTPPALVTLTLVPAILTLAVGQTQALALTGTFTDGTTQDLANTAVWTSSDETVATVTTPSGLVTARVVGQATVTATAEGKSTTATVTVTQPALTVFALTPTAPTIAVGQTVPFQTTGTFTDGATADLTGTVTWTSSDPTVATITSPGGLATALGAGQSTITATHADGMTASTPLTVVLSPLTLTITSPVDGATLVADRIRVRGTVSAATPEVGVSVNGLPAQVNGGHWTVEVPLQLGTNLLTALATTPTGVQVTASVSVTGTPQTGTGLRLRAVPDSGVAPLVVRWQVTTTTGRVLVQYELDANGTGAFGVPMATLDGVQTTYTAPGLVAPVVRVTDEQGTVYTASTVVNVLDRSELDALLQARWTGMKTALLANDLEGALRCFLPSQQERYRTLFAALSSVLPQIARDMAPIQLIALAERRAKYRLLRTHLYAGNLVTLTYYVYFVQTAAGDWAIEGF